MLDIRDIGLTEQCFTHVYEGVATMLAIERLLKSPEYLALEIVITPVEEKFAKWVMDNRGIEQHRLDRLDVLELPKYPLTYCIFPTPASRGGGFAHLLVDGNHRFVKAAMAGVTETLARVVPESIWRKFQIEVPVAVAEFFVSHESGMP